MEKVNSIIRIPTSLNGNFFLYWLDFLRPFHKMTARESVIVAAFLKRRYELSKVISDSNLLDKVLMSEDEKRIVRERCDITTAHFQVMMGNLRKKKVIVDNKVNPKFIPNITSENGAFQLLFRFELEGGESA